MSLILVLGNYRGNFLFLKNPPPFASQPADRNLKYTKAYRASTFKAEKLINFASYLFATPRLTKKMEINILRFMRNANKLERLSYLHYGFG